MKNYLLIVFCILNFYSNAQQWQWAIAADSVYGNQNTKMICKNNNDLYALICQDGPSIINNTYLDSGNVVIKTNTIGQIQWAKHYPGNIQSLYAENNGNIYLVGLFSDTLNFLGTALISHGGTDIFYGELDAAGNKLWIKSAGSLLNDFGNGIISDAQGNIFVAGQFKDDYYVGNLSITGNTGYYTYLLRCDLNGNYIESYRDSVYMDSMYIYTPYNKGLTFQKDASGTIYLSIYYNSTPCNYVCSGYSIAKINPVNYTVTTAAYFTTFEYLHSWTVNNDSTITANYNTQSHYGNSCDLFNVSTTNQHMFRKDLGDWYDGKYTPCITKGTGYEIIVGGYFDKCYLYHNNGGYDTLWYDNYFVIPDSLPAIMIGGINTSNQFTWLLRSEGNGASIMKSLISDEQGRCYSAGNYNIKPYYGPAYEDSLPHPITFGNTVLPAENKYTRFFIAGAETTLVTAVVANKTISSDFSIFPNPTSGHFTLQLNEEIQKQTQYQDMIFIFDQLGHCILRQQFSNSSTQQIDISKMAKGIYFVEVETGNPSSQGYEGQRKRINKKIILN